MVESSSQHPLYPFTEDDKLEVRGELGLKESTIQEGIDMILEWFQKQSHLVEAGIDSAIIERLLIANKGSVEKTKHRIDNLYKYRYFAPELIQNREKELNDSRDIWGAYYQIAMPKLCRGKRITIIKFVDPDPSKILCEQVFKNTFMLGDIRLKYEYCLGDIWILDMKLTSIGHVLRMNPIIMQKSSLIFHEGLHMTIFAIYILNATSFVQHVITFLKQFLNPKIMDRMVVIESLEDLYKFVPKKHLPKDYGGDEQSMEEFKDKYEKELRSTKTRQFLINTSNMISDESKRLNSDINEEYLAGSFRKLDLD